MRKLTYEDLRRVIWLSEPKLSPEGTEAAFVRAVSDYRTGKNRPRVMTVSVAGKERAAGTARSAGRTTPAGGEAPADVMPVSAATQTQRHPAYSPDGRWLAFLSEDSGEPQLWLKNRETGEEKSPLRLRYGIFDFSFSPDGKRIAFVTKKRADREENLSAEMTPAERDAFRWEKEHAPRAAENLIYKHDDAGGFRERTLSMVGLAEVDGAGWKIVSPEDISCDTPSFGAECLYFYGYPEKHEKELQPALYRRKGTKTERIRTEHMIYSPVPATELEGRPVFLGMDMGEDNWLALPFLAPGEAEGAGNQDRAAETEEAIGTEKTEEAETSEKEEKCLFTGHEACHGVDNLLVGDNHMGGMNSCWQRGEDGFYFLSARKGMPGLWKWREVKEGTAWAQPNHSEADALPHASGEGMEDVPPAGTEALSAAVPVLEGGTILDFDSPRGGRVLFLRSRYNAPAELFLRDLATGEEERLTHENRWTEEISFGKPAEMWVSTRDEKAVIHGFVLMPEGQERCPGVLYIHGGPDAFTVGDGFYFDAQMLAALGLAVVYCDPRGSTGYGRAFVSSGCAWGEEAMNDLEDFLKAAVARFPRIEEDRIGVTGGSYGGYMTMKLLLNRNLFRAGCAQRPFVNPATSYGTGDIGFISGSGKTDFAQYMLDRAKNSMMKDVRNLRVPLLLLHGEQDLRCGVEQSDQIFVLMRALHPEIPCRMVLFPGENHGVNRTGLMHNQIRHCRELCEWMDRYLNPAEEAPAEERGTDGGAEKGARRPCGA